MSRRLSLPTYNGGLSVSLSLQLSLSLRLIGGLAMSLHCSAIGGRASSRGGLGLSSGGLLVARLSFTSLGETLDRILFGLALAVRRRLRLHRRPLSGLHLGVGLFGGLLVLESLLTLCCG
jgi:hypothetical protein